MVVAGCEGMAAFRTRHLEVSFKVHLPKLVGLGTFEALRRYAGAFALAKQAVATDYIVHRGR